MSSLGAAAAATQGGGGAAASTSPLGIFSTLSTAAATAFASTQGATTGPRTVATPGVSLGGNTGILLLVLAVVAFFAFGGVKKLSAA
jgi:purine-cytosine permease-like protein